MGSEREAAIAAANPPKPPPATIISAFNSPLLSSDSTGFPKAANKGKAVVAIPPVDTSPIKSLLSNIPCLIRQQRAVRPGV